MPHDPRMSETEGKLVGFDQSRDPMLVVEGPQQCVRAFNAAAQALLGDREVIGRPLRDAAEDLLDRHVLDRYDAAYRTGEKQEVNAWAMTPWRGVDGAVRGVIGTSTVIQHPHVPHVDAVELVRSVQDALLPIDLPVVPGLDVAGRYLLAPGTSAGGDWFDAVVRSEGRVVLVTGDVVGRGVAASAVMAQLRAVLHERLAGGDPLDVSLAALDRYAGIQSESRATRVCVAEVDPSSGEVEYCTAGHPPPLVVSASGRTRFLAPTDAGPLATGTGLATRHARLEPGDVLLLYSDGLIHRPGTTTAGSTIEVARTAAEAVVGGRSASGTSGRPAELVCAVGLDRLVRTGGHDDDITMLAAQRVPPLAPFSASVPVEPSSVTQVRAAVSAWLAPLELRPVDDMSVLHALGELLTNAVGHAYADAAPRPRAVQVAAHLDPSGDLVCTVRDSGRWQPPGMAGDGGRGLALVRGLVDSLRLEHDDSGTTATFRHRLGRAAQLLAATSAGVRPTHSDRDAPYSTVRDGERFRVSGGLGPDEADQLRVDLQLETRGRTLPLLIDLAGVTHLGSAAVQVLHEAVAIDGADLVVHAPAGSIAQHILAQAKVPYEPVRAASGHAS
jgi:anti-sigma regulatory factor (Ser/Thr protein kinase)